MALVHKGNFSASCRRKFGGWIVEVWELDIAHPVGEFEHLEQPRYKEKLAALNAVIQWRKDAQAREAEWAEWNRRADEQTARALAIPRDQNKQDD